MLEKKLPFCIDHFSIATPHRDRPISLVNGLGFVTADCYTDRTVHFILENSYFELCTYQPNTTITWLTSSVPATNLPKVHSIRLSVKGADPNPMRNALLSAGIEKIGEINPPFRQHVRYGETEGEAGYQTFFIQEYEPFTDILFGATTHLTKELIVRNETKFPHLNGAKKLAYVTGYCGSAECFAQAEQAIRKLNDAAKAATDIGFNLDTFQIVDREAYLDEFGCEPRNDGLKLPIVSAAFSGCHLEFVKKRAWDMNLQYVEKNGKLYVDCRRIIGLFLVFMA